MRIGRFTQAAQSVVAELLRVENHVAGDEAQRTSLSVKVEIPTASMLGILAETMGQSRYSFGGEILDDFIADVFWSLPEDRRAAFAEKADALTNEYLDKQGIKVSSTGPAGTVEGDQTWRTINSAANMKQKEAA